MPRQEQQNEQFEEEQVVQFIPAEENYEALITALKAKEKTLLTKDEKELLRLNDKQVERLRELFSDIDGNVDANNLLVTRDLTGTQKYHEEMLYGALGASGASGAIVTTGACCVAGAGAIAATATTAGIGGVLIAVGGAYFLISNTVLGMSASSYLRTRKLIKRQGKIQALVKKIQEQKEKKEQQSEQKEKGQKLRGTQRPTNVLSESARVSLETEQKATNVVQNQARGLSRSSSRSSVSL